MQYDNRQIASSARAIIRCTYSVLGILLTLAFLGEFDLLSMLRWPLMGLLVILLIVTHTSGLCELAIQANESYVEIKVNPLLDMKGHTDTYSVFADRLLDYHHRNIMGIHFLRIDYIGHNGSAKIGHAGLTLMEGKQRRRLLDTLKKITDNNTARAAGAR